LAFVGQHKQNPLVSTYIPNIKYYISKQYDTQNESEKSLDWNRQAFVHPGLTEKTESCVAMSLAELFMNLGQMDSSIVYLLKINEKDILRNDTLKMSSNYYVIARAYQLMGAFTSANEYLDKAIVLSTTKKDTSTIIDNINLKCSIWQDQPQDTAVFVKMVDEMYHYYTHFSAKNPFMHYMIHVSQIDKFIYLNQMDSIPAHLAIVEQNTALLQDQFLEDFTFGIKQNISFIKNKKIDNIKKLESMAQSSAADKEYVYAKNTYQLLYDHAIYYEDFGAAIRYKKAMDDIEKVWRAQNQKGQIFDIQTKFETQKKEQRIVIQQSEIFQRKNQLYYLIAIITLLGAFIFFAIRAYLQKKKSADTITAQNAQLEVLNAANENLVYSLSHDIKEPMLGVLMLLKRLKIDDAYLQQASVSLENQVNAVSTIVNNLLQLKATATQQDKDTIIEYAAIQATLDAVVKSLDYKINEKQISIINELDKTPTLTIPLSTQKLYLILLNLISNAVKYSADGQGIHVFAEGKFICIRDHGTGIDSDTLRQIGNTNVESTKDTSGHKGSGLGLFLISNMLKNTGVSMSFEQATGGGTLVRIG